MHQSAVRQAEVIQTVEFWRQHEVSLRAQGLVSEEALRLLRVHTQAHFIGYGQRQIRPLEIGQWNLYQQLAGQLLEEERWLVSGLCWKPDEVAATLHQIVTPYGLQVRLLEGVLSVGVGGDHRTYGPVASISGSFPGMDVLAKLSTTITNATPVNRVVYEFISVPSGSV